MLWVCGRRRDDCKKIAKIVNSLFTTPDAKEQIWANPWHDLLVTCWRAVPRISESSCHIQTRVSAGGVWAVLTCGIPVRAEFLHPCTVMWFCILHVFVFYIFHVHQTAILSVSWDCALTPGQRGPGAWGCARESQWWCWQRHFFTFLLLSSRSGPALCAAAG